MTKIGNMKSMTLGRRRFLQTASLLAAPLAGGLLGPSRSRAADAGTIRFLAPAEDVSVYVQTKIAPKFKAETGITVLVDQVEYNGLYTKEVLEFGSGNYDVYQVDQVWAQAFAKSGYLLPLGDVIAPATLSSFIPNLSRIGNVDGKQWVVPFSAIPVNFTYRRDLMSAPATWTEVLDNAKRLTRAASGSDQAMWGFPIRGEAGNPITWTWLPMLWSFGGDAFDANFHPTYNNEAGLESVAFYAELYKYSPPGWLSDSQVANYMQQGQAAQTTLQMVFDAPMSSPEHSKVADKIAFAGMPKQVKQASILGLWTLGISAKSSNKENAAKFIEYLARQDIATEMALAGVIGATQAEIFKAPGAPSFFPVLSEVLTYVNPPPILPEGNRWFLITGAALQSALSGKQTVKEAMDDATNQVQKLLSDAGYYK
jgi:ABC-type glycerol-3-phosphate transport system substrate-binding protein